MKLLEKNNLQSIKYYGTLREYNWSMRMPYVVI